MLLLSEAAAEVEIAGMTAGSIACKIKKSNSVTIDRLTRSSGDWNSARLEGTRLGEDSCRDIVSLRMLKMSKKGPKREALSLQRKQKEMRLTKYK